MNNENITSTNINDNFNMKLKPCNNTVRSVSPLTLPPTHKNVNTNTKELKNNVHYCDFCNCIIL